MLRQISILDTTRSGSQVAEHKNITLSVGDRTRIDFKLQIGSAEEQVTVEANPVAVQTHTGEIRNLITGRQISDLAVNGTSLFQLAALAPGASNDITNYKDVPVGGDTNVNGQRTARPRGADHPQACLSAPAPTEGSLCSRTPLGWTLHFSLAWEPCASK